MSADAPVALALCDILPTVQGALNLRFASLARDYRQVQPGDLFVAIQASDGDGHDFASEAIARGACGILAERLLPASVPVAIVEDTREALGSLCQAMVGRPA